MAKQSVDAFMAALDHPLKAEIEALRIILREASEKLEERVKWVAPSYYYQKDMAAFNPRDKKRVHLIFLFYDGKMLHDPILEGDYKDRRMVYFESMEDVLAKKEALQKVVREWVELMEK